MNIFKRLFSKKEKNYTKEDIALEVSKYLFEQKQNETYKTSIQLRLVNEKPSRSCTVDTIEKFIAKKNTIEGIIRYELLIRWISEDSSKMNMIQTKIDLVNNSINIKYENNENIDFTESKVNEIKNIIQSMGITPTIEEKIKEEPKFELISLGILGEYNIYDINYETTDSITKEQEYKKIKEIITNLKNNINKINNSLFYEIHSNLDCVVANLWEDESFNKIIDVTKLPQEFSNLSNEDKHKTLFDFNENVTKENIIQITKLEKPFWNIENIKSDLIIKNVKIEEQYNKLIIEFNGILNCFIAYVEIDTNNYEITNFDPS